MNKRMTIAGALIAFVLALALIGKLTLDDAVADAIAYYGSQALGTEVSVSSVMIRTVQGRGTIRGLHVAQPDGFGFGDAIAFDEITLDFDINSLVSGDPYVIEFVRVASPEVVYIVDEHHESNLGRLQDNLADYMASDIASDRAAPPPEDAGDDPLIRIERLEVERGSIEAGYARLGLGRTMTKLPSMTANDVGGPAGMTPGDLASTLGQRFIQRTMLAIASSAIGSSLDKAIGEGSRAVRGLLDSLRRP